MDGYWALSLTASGQSLCLSLVIFWSLDSRVGSAADSSWQPGTPIGNQLSKRQAQTW